MGTICQEYKEFSCIENLGTYKEIFYRIVEHYGKDLNNKIMIDGSIYTAHNFDNHCMGIYKIISDVLLDSKQAYNSTVKFTEKELFLLDLAVLFHDYSMSVSLTVERKNHSAQSAQYVQKLYDNQSSLFFKEANLIQNEIKALKAIIKAHSDVKDGTVLKEEQGIRNPQLKDNMPARTGIIRAKLLAGILRMADELDITSDRLGNTNIEEELKKVEKEYSELQLRRNISEEPEIVKKVEKYQNYIESLKHWENLHLFSQVYRKAQDDKIYLEVDSEYLHNLLDSGEANGDLARRIVEVYNKVKKEWAEIREYVIEQSEQKLDVRSIIPITEICIDCENNDIMTEINKHITYLEKLRANETNAVVEEENIVDTDEKKEEKRDIEIINKELANIITQEIKKRHLLKVGHFLLDDFFCARDWIDTKEIVETKTISDLVIGAFITHIIGNCDFSKKYLFVGLDLEGSLIASRIAMSLKKPFSYIIPAKEMKHAAEKESEISIQEYDKIILITDVIVTFDTIKKSTRALIDEKNSSEKDIFDKIDKIYSIFYREGMREKLDDNSKWKKKTVCINNEFPIELFKTEECQYAKNGECYALNKRVR